MLGDDEILRAFEVADDGMQGVLGYYFYTQACQEAAPADELPSHLPKGKLQITLDWDRSYAPKDLVDAMRQIFPSYHARTALISAIGIFEAALGKFRDRLRAANHSVGKEQGYKKMLKWAIDIALQSNLGAPHWTKSIPDQCLEVDHARRLRNLWLHNNGVFDEKYGSDGIKVSGEDPIVDPLYHEHMKRPSDRSSFTLTPDGYKLLSCAHIGLLHHIHHTIQRIYFGATSPYHYGRRGKRIEWSRLLGG